MNLRFLRSHFFGIFFIPAMMLLSAITASSQTVIPITNFDFETGGATDGSANLGLAATGWVAVGTLAGSHNLPGSDYGYVNPTAGLYPGTNGTGINGTMSGPNFFCLGTGVRTGQGIEQTLVTTFSANTNYSVTVALGLRAGDTGLIDGSGGGSPLRINLLAGTTLLASGTGTFINSTAGTFADVALNYSYTTGDSSLVGQALTLQLVSFDNGVVDGSTDIDNVRLTATAIPEPTLFAALLGVTAFGVVVYRRRQTIV